MTDVSQLNQGQEAAAETVFKFLLSDEKEMAISGPAGTGKTHLMKHIMAHTIPEYYASAALMGRKVVDYEIMLCATTNKAAEVLAQSTGLPCSTIHSALSLKVKDDYSTGVSKITRTSGWKVFEKTVIFIDEASMIDSTLYKHLMAGTNNTCKIIYLGDHCQMAPVFEDISPVYRNQKNTAFLTEPMRNAGQPALVNLCSQLRHTVETLEFEPIVPVPGVIDYVDPDEAMDFVNKTFAKEQNTSRILGYSNSRMKQYLQYIRDIRGYPSLFVPGERLINNTALQLKDAMLRVDEELVVKHIVDQPFVEPLDPKDPAAEIESYRISVEVPRLMKPLTVRVPVDPDHLKALSNHYARKKDWTMFYWLKNNFVDLRPKDAATVYKAQGSTYDTVLLDLDNIGSCKNPDQLARMLYVGASRAQSRLLLFGNLPNRLFTQAA